MSDRIRVSLRVEPENPDGDKELVLEPTENYNYVSMKVGGHWYDVAIDDLYRATMPFMDIRHEGKENE